MAFTARSKDRARNNAAIFSVVAIAILLAIPATVAYAESSDDRIYTPMEIDTTGIGIYSVVSSENALDSLITSNHGTINYLVDATTASTNKIHMPFNGSRVTASDLYRVYVDFDFGSVNVSSVTFSVLVNGDWNNNAGSFTYNERTDRWELEASAIDRIHWNGASNVLLNITTESSFTTLEGEANVTFYTADVVFTDDVVEIIALISGILLIVFALFATPWISVSQVTRTARKGARSVKNGAKKATRSVKRSVKKR